MTGNQIRQKFLQYFQDKEHTVVESSSLVPQDDPTLLFTNAGMVQFKTVFMGEDRRDYVRAVTSQRCVRAGGKHNDLENVGYTARHHTFFEMLGNFSFGDYFKEDAIHLAWDFLVRELGVPAEKLWVSIFDDDDEAYALWEKVEGLPKGRIVRMGEKDNFWSMGDTGPCGPCSEIHIDQGVEAGCGREDCALGCDCDRYLELWNLVFMQFNRSEDGTMTPLPRPSIDTGMGLERVAAVLQGKVNNYDSDLFSPVISRLETLSGRSYVGDQSDGADRVAMRVIADHARATTFLVSDGVLPSNEGRGYVLRRIMRRAIRYGRNLGLKNLFLEPVCAVVVEGMLDSYPHLQQARELLIKVVNNEEERFRETLENGLTLLDEEIERIAHTDGRMISGGFIFKLYDTFGFPVDIVRDISLERGVTFDEAGFLEAMERQRALSRASQKGGKVHGRDQGVRQLAEAGVRSTFVGYGQLTASSQVCGLLALDGVTLARAAAGDEVRVLVAATPFYGESGGQLGDSGVLLWPGGRARVLDTTIEGEGMILHRVRVAEGTLVMGQELELAVDEQLRGDTAANHTATHLLQAALREVLGDHVKQSGSLVGTDRLRFDFTHFSQPTAEELRLVEEQVNRMIRADVVLDVQVLSRDEAVQGGATALFGEKYGDEVRVVAVPGFSKELCGGTHVRATGEIGLFKIISEGGIAAGIRRIEALTGRSALAQVQNQAEREQELCRRLNAVPEALAEKMESLFAVQKQLEKKVAELSARLAATDLDTLLSQAVDVEGVRVMAAEIPLDNAKTLRDLGDRVRERMASGVAVLGGVVDGKAAILAIVSRDLTKTIPAGALIKEVAALVGGKGGGRPDMAQAGGPMADKLPGAIAAVADCVRRIILG